MSLNPLYLSVSLLLMACFYAPLAQASGPIFPDSIYTPISDGLGVYPMCEGELSFEQVSDSSFRKNFQYGINYEQGCKHWLRLDFFLPKKASGYYLLKQPDWEGRTVYYFPKPGGGYSEQYSGLSVPPSQRSFNYPKYNKAKALLVGGDTLTIFLKVDFQAQDYMRKPRVSIKAISMEYAIDKEAFHGTLMMTVVAIFVLATYNLAVFFYTRDRSYLYYSLSLFLVCPYLIVINREVWHWITVGGLGSYVGRIGVVCGVLAGFFYLRFSVAYLGGEEELPSMAKWVRWTVNAVGVITILSSVYILHSGYGYVSPVFIINDIMLLLTFLLIFFFALLLVGKKQEPAKHYALASLAFLPFFLIFFMQGESAEHYGYLDLIDGNAFTRASLKIGVVVQALAFSLALAARINFLRKRVMEQALQAEKSEKVRLIEIQRLIEKQNEELEVRVQSRTKQLQEAVEELKVSEDSLDKLNKTKDHFFALIAHDLRGPVASFQGLASMVQYQIKKQRTEKIGQMMAQVDESANQLNVLLDNLLQWAQMQIGGKSYQPEEVSLLPLAQDIQQIYAGTAISKNIETSIKISPPNLSAYADPSAMSTVIRNLWSNALKFTEGGKVSLEASIEQGQLHIIISDTGRGIPEQKLATLFEVDPYKSSKGTRGEKGNGLGLLLCKEFIEQHNGKIWAESQVDKGTKIHLLIPQ